MRTFSQFNEKGEREHNRVQKQFRKCRNRPKEELVTDAATGEKMWVTSDEDDEEEVFEFQVFADVFNRLPFPFGMGVPNASHSEQRGVPQGLFDDFDGHEPRRNPFFFFGPGGGERGERGGFGNSRQQRPDGAEDIVRDLNKLGSGSGGCVVC
eukprot:CAMPEP_0175146088 /NCGR_PEP_ID=MMETSP0087-20121206/15173_1 /TAXON_ID=136419 /ORGANISM="Unknown Unknown, Strain D1" /LENGTH=152 /DNA_ID=CAMNT_0016430989 /DNA_START=120 /DNA_END=578 /DNA_ORIENTATION=-